MHRLRPVETLDGLKRRVVSKPVTCNLQNVSLFIECTIAYIKDTQNPGAE